ncbi:mitochondrial ribosomal protein L4-like protein [Leptotrombidium deliense]|uniref:Large ribosomal subunit protein uL4m n=1 Tax=Leptotrombidium deliense TaxID=299467 RepID=A0A443SI55_9ACAR|nr:mitochondrial ribosomal protein L4-like protein [Leptotrombidium deliense]
MVLLRNVTNLLLRQNYGLVYSSLRNCQVTSQASLTENSTLTESPQSTLSQPILFKRELQHTDMYNKHLTPPREAWLLNFDSMESRKLNIIELHPEIFAAFPRVDVIHENIKWQTTYSKINWIWLRTRAELAGSNRKPWPQKGTGRARHGSTTAPQWIKGGWCHGPRGPTSNFYMLDFHVRVNGLISALSIKFAQNDLKIVDTLEKFPSDDPQFLSDMMDKREWGPSVLIVDKNDIFPRNIALAAENINHINLMPVYGLNVFSMMKHETLVLTLEAAEEIERKLLYQLTRTDLEAAAKHIPPETPGLPDHRDSFTTDSNFE